MRSYLLNLFILLSLNMYSIHSLKFGVLSPEKIRAMSLSEVVTDELYESNRPKYGGLRDPRFGVSSRRGICPSCQKTWSDCSGHFGHFELPCPCFHIGWMYEVLQWLRKTCVHCGHVSNSINKKKCIKCQGHPHRYFKKNSTTICVETPSEGIRTLLAPEAHQILSKIQSTDESFHPSSLVLTVLPIPPNCVRPSPTLDGEEVRGEDDITRRLLYVIRIAKAYKKASDEISIVKAHAGTRLQDALHMYIDQTRMSTKVKNTQKSISERLRGKTGRIRGTLMGKRCNFTSRTVITGDAMLDMREVGVPKQVAETLTIVENINRLNFNVIKEMIREKDTRIKYVIRKDGTRLDLKTMRGQVDLQVGCSVERQLKDGDLVLFNRQPSLHRMSIMCHRVKIMSEGKTFRLNLSCTTPYNADFDGDEMNLHALQTYESRADALELMSVAKNIITPQSNRPVMGIVQDTLLSCYLMTQPGVLLDQAEISNMAMWIVDFKSLPTPVEPGRWTGLQCISMLFPTDFVWKDTILNGQLLKGPIGKKALGRSHGSIIHRLYNDYGPDRTCQFINELQRINHIWLATQGFSIGIGDMRISATTAKAVRQACANVDQQAVALRKEYAEQAEPKINRMLNQTRDSMGLIAKNAMHPDNSLGRMVSSGSKGSMVNILQIMACVGQQNCQGKRIQPTLGNRTLPMFKPFDDSPRARGFVKHSYIDGLTPDEYWNHTVGGREGLVDTAVKTSATGYIQRRLVKSLESIHVANDTSVRDSQNRVIQFLYGEDGIDGMCHEMVVCPFENLVSPPSDKNWPELSTAWQQYHSFKSYQLGEKWAVPIPCQRLLNKHASKPVASPEETRRIVTPLLNIVKQNQLYHIYALATLTQHQCNVESLQKVVDILTKKWYQSIVAPGEMVGVIAAQSVGEPTTQMSAAYDQQVIVDINGTVKRMQIGLLVDNILNNTSRESQEMVVTHLKCVGVTPTETVAWTNITHVSRHPANGIMLRVNTKHNRSLSMTASHSFLVRRDNRVTAMPGHKLVVGDALPVVKNLPKAVTEKTTLFPLNAIAGHFIGAVLAEGFVNKYTISFCGREHDWVKKIAKPFAHLLGLDAHIKRTSVHTLGTEDMTTANIHSKELAKYFAEQFGKTSHHKTIPGWCLQAPDIFVSALLQSYFDGDGNVSCKPGHYAIHCHSVSKTLIEMISLCLARFGMPLYITASKYKTPGGKRGILWEGCVPAVFAKRFRDSVGFSLPEKKKLLEKLYVMKFKKGFQARVPGMSGVLSALRQYTSDTPTRKEINRIIKRGNGITIQMLHTLIGHAKQNNVPSTVLSELKQAVNADVWWDKIETIEQYETDELVYDFTVNEKLQSFMLGNGCFVHNTLNTFHQAGNSAKNVTLGLPRLEELINASSKMKTPVLTIHADTILRPENAWRLKTEIQKTTLKDILLSHSFELNEKVLKEYLLLPDNKRWNLKINPKKVLNCTINRKKMIQRGLNIYEVVRTLRENAKNMYYAYSDNSVGEITLMARPKKEASFYQYVKSLMDTTIKGSSKIPNVSIRTEGDEFVIDTEGIDLGHIHSIRAIGHKHIKCNDIWAIKNTYGVEAARAALLNEIHGVVSFDGSYVNMRHLMVIVDWMTWAGGITALNRHGVKKMMDGATPIKRATFEQPVEILHNAAVKGLCDELNGVSEQLLVGKMPVCGSHFNGTVVEKEYQQLWDNDDWKPEESDDDEDLFGDCVWQPQPQQSDWESHTTFANDELPAVVVQPVSPQLPAWQQQQPAWQQQQKPAWQQQQQPTAPAYSPASPAYSPASPAYSPASPAGSPTAPAYSPASPAYSPSSPAYSPAAPAGSPVSPAYSPTGLSSSPEGYSSSVDEESPKRHKKNCILTATKRTVTVTDEESSTKRQKRI